MIPKIIHYCWFSNPPEYPSYILECFDTWKKILPDYEIMLWNADNFDVSQCKYVEEAYEEKKYAFASDYVRLWALYNYGGIYLDSDIKIIKNMDVFLNDRAFTGFEKKDSVAAWILGSEKHNPIFKELMDEYNDLKFIISDGQYDTTPNPVRVTRCLRKHGLKLDGSTQDLGLIKVYAEEYFCPFNPYREGDDCFSDNTHANHLFNGMWMKKLNEKEQAYRDLQSIYIEKYGPRLGKKICALVNVKRNRGIKDALIFFYKEWIVNTIRVRIERIVYKR